MASPATPGTPGVKPGGDRHTGRITPEGHHPRNRGGVDHIRGPAARAVTGGRFGDDEDANLGELKRRYPRWRIWRGPITGDYWAMPPRGHPTRRNLISASDPDQLAQRLAEAEARHD